MSTDSFRRFALMTMCGCGLAAGPAVAQVTPTDQLAEQQATGLGEIIVTARKREESIMRAPVDIQTVTQTQVENQHLESIQDITTAIPNLEIYYSQSIAGITANLRGLGNGSAALFIDQDVALNLDGMTSNRGTLFRSAMFDIDQISVLKGPQSLFFGKSTSAGVIAIQSADPTPQWETKLTSGYEFVADETDVNGYIAGPITDQLGVRLAFYHETSEGYLDNPNPFNPRHRVPAETGNGGRLTVKWDSDFGLHVKLKGQITDDKVNMTDGELNEYKCYSPGVGGVNVVPLNQYSPCVIGKYTSGFPAYLPYNPDANFDVGSPAYASYSPFPIFKDGLGYGYTKTGLGVLDVDYDVAPGLTLSSVTGWDYVSAVDSGDNPIVGIEEFGLADYAGTHEFSQEVRLTSDWKDSWFNFMAGGLHTTQGSNVDIWLVYNPYTTYNNNFTNLHSTNDSGFAQFLITPTNQWELSVGARYQNERREFVDLFALNNFTPGGLQEINEAESVPLSDRLVEEHATTPEVTLTYKPTEDVTAFLSYKKGYKGPGFNASLSATAYNGLNNSVSPVSGEHVNGVEGGVKAMLLNRQLAFTATPYHYNYDALQVAFDDLTHDQVIVRNGANARVQGIELEADYSPSAVSGLTMNAFTNYNESYFTSFPHAPCYGDEPTLDGCIYTPALVYQNLTGKSLNYAPKWTGNLGGTYKWNLNDKYGASFELQTGYSGRYFTTPELNALGIQPSYALLDVGVHLHPNHGAWELSFLCKDCTDRYYVVNGLDGGAGSGPPGRGAVVVQDVARPRQLLLQVTVRPKL